MALLTWEGQLLRSDLSELGAPGRALGRGLSLIECEVQAGPWREAAPG